MDQVVMTHKTHESEVLRKDSFNTMKRTIYFKTTLFFATLFAFLYVVDALNVGRATVPCRVWCIESSCFTTLYALPCSGGIRQHEIDAYKMQPDPNDSLGPLDFGITDSLFLPDSARPSLLQTVSNPRDLLAIALLVFRGCSVAIFLAMSCLNKYWLHWKFWILIWLHLELEWG
jgi:hypothetical protein